MKTKRLAFALFAAAILFSMVREWNAGALCANDSRSSGIAAPRPPSLPSHQWSAMEATAHHRGATAASLNTGGGPPWLDRWIVAKKGLACGS